MGTLKVLIVCVFCILVLLAVDCAAKPITIALDDPLVGTWVNEEYDRTSEYNAKWEIFRTTWWVYPGKSGRTEGFCLYKVNASETSLESVFSGSGYPEELSPIGSFYRICYKRK